MEQIQEQVLTSSAAAETAETIDEETGAGQPSHTSQPRFNDYAESEEAEARGVRSTRAREKVAQNLAEPGGQCLTMRLSPLPKLASRVASSGMVFLLCIDGLISFLMMALPSA